MIEAVELQKKYRLVHGEPSNISGQMKMADLHVHEGGDTTDTPWRIVRAAVRRGLDLIAVTNHDNAFGYERASRMRDRIEKKREGNHHLTIIRAAEVTAEDNRHVLVYNLKHNVPVGSPLPRLLEEVDKQDATASMAHPELGSFSPTEKDIEELLEGDNPPFALEVHNGGARQIDRYSPTVEKYGCMPVVSFIKNRLPKTGSNSKAHEVFERFKDSLLGATGGSDAHSARHVGDVITCYPAEMELFDAIEKGKSVVMEHKKPKRATGTNLAIGTLRGIILDNKRKKVSSKML